VYKVFICDAAKKDLRKLGKAVAEEVLRHIKKKLETDPASYGDPLSGDLAGYYKLRVGDHRIVYKIVDDGTVWILVLAVGKRSEGDFSDIYSLLNREKVEKRLKDFLRELDTAEEP
jgi:mRNA interferase RelE/StbE